MSAVRHSIPAIVDCIAGRYELILFMLSLFIIIKCFRKWLIIIMIYLYRHIGGIGI